MKISEQETRSILFSYKDAIWADDDTQYLELNEWNNGSGATISNSRNQTIDLSIEEMEHLTTLINKFLHT